MPCANAGQGELVSFPGSMFTTISDAFENGWVMGYELIKPALVGTGQTTGVTYRVLGETLHTVRTSPEFVASTNNANNFSAVGGGVAYHIHENAKITVSVDANGNLQFTVIHDNFFVFCQ